LVGSTRLVLEEVKALHENSKGEVSRWNQLAAENKSRLRANVSDNKVEVEGVRSCRWVKLGEH